MIAGLDFLTLAEGWIVSATEAEWRSAVSRAYYGAFHSARRLLRDLGFRVPRADRAHAYLWMRLANCSANNVMRAGTQLNALRSSRNQADYDIEQALPHADALLMVQTARQIVQALTAARVEPIRTQITDAMKRYERDVLKDVTWQP